MSSRSKVQLKHIFRVISLHSAYTRLSEINFLELFITCAVLSHAEFCNVELRLLRRFMH